MAMQRCYQQPWIIFLCSVILGGTFVCSDIVVEKPQDVIAFREEPLVWDCSVQATSNNLTYEVVWVFDGHVINNATGAHKYVHANGSLYIASVEAERDQGKYRCCAKNVTGILCSQEALLNIAELPQFETHPSPTVTYQGGVARFECIIHGYPKASITWKHNRSNIKLDSRYVIQLPNGVLQIHNVSMADEGLYKCVATNIVQTRRSRTATLSVLPQEMALIPLTTPVIISAPPRQKTVVAGEDLLLECLVQGSPLQVTWRRKDGRPIRTDGVSYPGGSNMVMRSIQPVKDNATYYCYATNPQTGQNIVAETQVTIATPPVFRVTPDVDDKVIGSTLRLWCLAIGEPHPTITWLHNGLPATIDDYHSHLLNNDYVVQQVWWEDAGVYQCEARNGAGTILAAGSVAIIAYDSYPGPVTGLSVEVLSSDTMRVTWGSPENANDIIAYTVEYKPLVEGAQPLEKLVQRHQPLNVTLDGLMAFTQYRVNVQCFTTRAPCPRNYQCVKTYEAAPSTWPEFSVTSESPTSITVTWNEIPMNRANGVITGYAIAFYAQGSLTYNRTEVDSHLREFVLSDVMPNSNYSVKMAAKTSVGYGVYSDWVTVTTPEVYNETTPKPPQHLQVSHLNHTALLVTFQAGPPPPITEGFKLQVVLRGEEVVGNTVLLPANATECIVVNLNPSTVYNVRILGFNQFGDGRYSTQTTKTPPPPVVIYPDVLPPPAKLNATGLSASSVLIQWDKPHTQKKIVSFIIEYSVLGGNVTKHMEVDGSTHQLLLNGLLPFTEYEYKIRSVGTSQTPSIASPLSRVFTLEDKPSDPPSSVEAEPVDPHTVKVIWKPPAKPNGIITRYTVMYQKDPNVPEESWECEQKDGSSHHSTIESLSSDTKYYFKVRAGTQAGDGPPTDAVAAQTLSTTSTDVKNVHNLEDGILIGVCLSLVCIIICGVLITYRFRHICWRRSAPPPCNCTPENNAPCVHYWSNGSSQRVYMSVPCNEEVTDTGLPMLTRYHGNGQVTPSQLQNGYNPKGSGGHGKSNGHGPPRGDGHGHLLANGHSQYPGTSGHWLPGWQKKEARAPFPPPGPLGSYDEGASLDDSSQAGSGVLHPSLDHHTGENDDSASEHKKAEIPPLSSTSHGDFCGSKLETSVRYNKPSIHNDSTDSCSSQHNVSHLPPTDVNPLSSINSPSSQGLSYTSGDESCHRGAPSRGKEGWIAAQPTSTTTLPSVAEQHPKASQKLPPTRHSDSPQVLKSNCLAPVIYSRDSSPSEPQDPQGEDSWERWSPSPTVISDPDAEIEEDGSTVQRSHPNRTVKTCTV
ncbi:protogenin B-like [Diadema setosum]|uniref:protogenin B-like n=1 Tax=Diadema setosum TaxID=31175 RepID=UPI003B3B2C3C